MDNRTPKLPNHIQVITQTPHLNFTNVEVVVTLPTFRRPEHLLRTLESLKAQVTERQFAIIVVENEAEEQAGAKVAAPLFAAGTYRGLVIVETQRGNCNAYNAAWLTALGYFPNMKHVLVIDDDELADPSWLENMMAAAERYSVDLVGGPQVPVFDRPGSEAWARHPVFLPTYQRSGPVPTLYSSGNLAVARPVLEAAGFPFLDPMFNFTGGGDSDFISRSVAKGFRTGWCAEAPVHETVPARRLEGDWIRARGLRNGMISTMMERRKRKDQPLGAARVFVKSALLLGFSPVKALYKAVQARWVSVGAYYIHVGLGRVMAHFGYENEQYRNPDKN